MVPRWRKLVESAADVRRTHLTHVPFVTQSQFVAGTDHGSNDALAVIEGHPSAISLPIMQSAGTLLLGSPQQQEPRSQGLNNLLHE